MRQTGCKKNTSTNHVKNGNSFVVRGPVGRGGAGCSAQHVSPHKARGCCVAPVFCYTVVMSVTYISFVSKAHTCSTDWI